MERARIYRVVPTDYSPELKRATARVDDDDDDDDITKPALVEALTVFARQRFPEMKRGDVLLLEEFTGKFNDGVYLCDGQSIVNQYFGEGDAEGEVCYIPKEFPILGEGGFVPKYWSEITPADSEPVVWFDAAPHAEEILANLDPHACTAAAGACSHFAHLGRRYNIAIPHDVLENFVGESEFRIPPDPAGIHAACVGLIVDFAVTLGLLPWYHSRKAGEEGDYLLEISPETVNMLLESL